MVLPPLDHHHWMFFYRSTIEIDGFSMVFPNSGAMVSDGFDLEKDQQMRIIVTDPILRELCVLFRIQITLLLVNFWWKSTLKDSMFVRFKVGCCVCWTFSTLICYHHKLSMVFKVTITIEWNGWGQPLGSMVFRWFWGKTTIGNDGFRWFCTIGPTMEWLCTIVEVYYGLKPPNLKNYNIFGMLWTSVLTWYHPIGHTFSKKLSNLRFSFSSFGVFWAFQHRAPSVPL